MHINLVKTSIVSMAVVGALIYAVAFADVAPSVNTTVHNGSHGVVTSAVIGTGVHANPAVALAQ